MPDTSVPKKVGGKARKSTQKAKKSVKEKAVLRERNSSLSSSFVSTKKKKGSEVQQIDPNARYEIDEIGPIYLAWAKRRIKNDKGRIVKEWYIKNDKKHLIWVKWTEPFKDEEERGNDFVTSWSAEPQDVFEGAANQAAIQKALNDKVVWPWIDKNDEDFLARRDLLKKKGYREWIPKKGSEKDRGKWKMKFAVEAETDPTSGNNTDSDNSESTSGTEHDDEEEEDEV